MAYKLLFTCSSKNKYLSPFKSLVRQLTSHWWILFVFAVFHRSTLFSFSHIHWTKIHLFHEKKTTIIAEVSNDWNKYPMCFMAASFMHFYIMIVTYGVKIRVSVHAHFIFGRRSCHHLCSKHLQHFIKVHRKKSYLKMAFISCVTHFIVSKLFGAFFALLTLATKQSVHLTRLIDVAKINDQIP